MARPAPVIDIHTRRPVLRMIDKPTTPLPPAPALRPVPPRAMPNIRWYVLLGALALGLGGWLLVARLAELALAGLR